MDLTNISNLTGHFEPIEMPVSELLMGGYTFSVPSYQRGYRWESSEVGNNDNGVKQVDDLLNDLTMKERSREDIIAEAEAQAFAE